MYEIFKEITDTKIKQELPIYFKGSEPKVFYRLCV